ncbi:hypothetical protein BH09PAT3_BH09PAT3_4860 [soil metagenome]
MSAPVIKHHTFVESWEPFVTPQVTLASSVYEQTDGRRHVFMWPQTSTPGRVSPNGDVTRVGYRNWDGHVQFLGMAVERSLRGGRIGQRLLGYFLDKAEQHEGTFVGTGNIHKPLIALTLARAGFQPATENFIAEILPKSSFDASDIPKVRIVHQATACDDIITHSPGGRFYDIVPDSVAMRYPINSPDMTVALHTDYVQPK